MRTWSLAAICERPRATIIAVIFATAWGTIRPVTADPGEGRSDETEGSLAWLSKRAGLVILVVLATIVGLRLVSKWLKWLLIAVAVGALFYLVMGRSSESDEQSNES